MPALVPSPEPSSPMRRTNALRLRGCDGARLDRKSGLATAATAGSRRAVRRRDARCPSRGAGAFARLEACCSALHGHSATIESPEVVGDATSDQLLRYRFRKPESARLNFVNGTHAGTADLRLGKVFGTIRTVMCQLRRVSGLFTFALAALRIRNLIEAMA